MKNNFHCDDLFSIIAATPANLNPEGKIAKRGWYDYNFEKGKIYTGEQIKKSLFAFDTSFKSIVKDLKTIRSSNIERQHPTLYYYVMRIWCTGFDGLDYEKIIHRGCYLNLIFFSISFFFMFKLLSLIKKDDNFIILGLLFGFVCIGSTLTMLLMRPYALQECLFIIVNYTLILLWKKIKNNEKLNIKDICLYSLVFSLFLQTGYFTLIYAGIVFVFTIIALILYKKSYYLKNFLLISSLAIIFTWICYPGYFDFHTDNEHIETVSKAANSFNWTVLKNTAGNLLEYLKAFIIYPVIFIPLLILFIYGKLVPSVRKFLFDDRILAKEQLCICLSIISFCIMWAIISCYIAPYPTFRYIAAASVFFALLSAMLSYNFKRYIQILILIVYFICSINTSKLNIYPQYHYTIGGLQVPFLITKNHESAFFNNIAKQNIPVIVVPKHWYNVNYFIYFDNSQKIKFEDTDYINSSEYSEYIIITNGYVYKQSMNNVVNNMGNSSIKNK